MGTAFGVAAAGVPGDRVAVFLPAQSCESGLLEMEVWSRERSAWLPHPEHPRVLANSCQVEPAGALLNETRFRCVAVASEAEPSPWRRVQVFSPAWMQRCTLPVPAPARLGVRLETPAPGDVVSNLERSVALSGWLERGAGPEGRVRAGKRVWLLLDRSPAVRETGPAASRLLLSRLRDRGEPVDSRTLAFASRGTAASRSGDPPGDLRPRDLAAALEAALDGISASSAAPGAPAPGVVVWVDAAAGYPVGAAAASDPRHRARLVALAGRLAAQGAWLEIVGLGGGQVPEVVREMRAAAPGGVVWSPTGAAPAVLAGRLVADLAPKPERVRVENLDLGESAPQIDLEESGRFRARVPLEEGPNRIRVAARLASGEEAEAEIELVFDPSRPRAEWLEIERARLEALRARKGRRGEVTIEPDETSE